MSTNDSGHLEVSDGGEEGAEEAGLVETARLGPPAALLA